MSKARDIADLDFNAPDIDGGNIDGAVIGGTTPAAGSFSGVNVSGGSQLGQDYAYFKSNSTSNASLTLRKDSSGADAIDFLQLRNNGNGLIGKIEGDGDISFGAATFTGTLSSGAITSSGNFLLEATGNPSITNKTTGAGNNPTFRLQADTNYWDFQGTFSNSTDDLFFMYNGASKLSLTNTGDVKVYGHLFGDDDSSYFRINAGPGGGGAIYLNGTNRTSYNNHIQYMADVHNFGDADGSPINTLQVVSDASLVTVNGALNVTGNGEFGVGAANANNYHVKVRAGTTGLSRVIMSDTSDRGYVDYNHNGDYFSFKTSGAEALTIRTGGDVTAAGNLSSSGGASKVGGTSVVFTNDSFTITVTAQTVVPRSAITGLPTGTYLMTISLSGGGWYSSKVIGIVQHYNGTTNSNSSGGPNGIYLTSGGHAQNSGTLFARYQTTLGNANNHGLQIWGDTQTTAGINIQWKRLA